MTEPKFYVTRPIKVQAMQWTGDNFEDIQKFCPRARRHEMTVQLPNGEFVSGYDDYLIIPTLEGAHLTRKGDYIYKWRRDFYVRCAYDFESDFIEYKEDV